MDLPQDLGRDGVRKTNRTVFERGLDGTLYKLGRAPTWQNGTQAYGDLTGYNRDAQEPLGLVESGPQKNAYFVEKR